MTHDRTWSAFTDQIARSLLGLEEGDALIIRISDNDDQAHHVQVMVYDETMGRGEVSSNTFLPQKHQPTGLQMDQLVSLGWRAPMPELDGGSPNFFIDVRSRMPRYCDDDGRDGARLFNVHHPFALDLSGAEVLADIGYGTADLLQADTTTFGQDGHYI